MRKSMTCSQVMEVIEQEYDRKYAMEWDNVGLLVGREEKEISRIYIAVDATDEVIGAAAEAGADLLITHHPMIFAGMRQITDRDFIGRRILKLIRKDMAYYAMHTNYDVMGMGKAAADRLGWRDCEVLQETGEDPEGHPVGIGRITDVGERTLAELCADVKQAFLLPHVQVFGKENMRIRRAAICPGSGKSVIDLAREKGADVLITGDIGHHDGIDALACGLAVIDAGHYGIEKIFVEEMAGKLRGMFPELEILEDIRRDPFVIL